MLFVDIETSSAVDIKNVLNYVSHKSTRILCAVAKSADSRPCMWIPANVATKLRDNEVIDGCDIKIRAECPFPIDVPWVAHNAHGFDSLIWSKCSPKIQPLKWIDTMPMCRAAGLPGQLEKVSQILFKEGKEDFSTILETLCKARVSPHGGRLEYHTGTRHLWETLVRYNVKDVLLLERLFAVVSRYFDDYEIMERSQEINERGVYFDKKFAVNLWELWGKVQYDAAAHIEALTKNHNPSHFLTSKDLRSHVKVKAWLAAQGCRISSLDKRLVDEELSQYNEDDNPNLPLIEEVLECRELAVRSSKSKVERVLEIALSNPDHRVKHTTVLNGAHTGRYTSRGVQIHNLARISDPEEIDRLLQIYSVNGILVPSDLGENPGQKLTELTRPIFAAPPGSVLDIGDYSQIEARTLAWLTGETTLLRAFSDPSRDVYCEMASKLTGRLITKTDKLERQLGKVVVLGCGYGMGKKRFEVFCARSKPQIDLKTLNLTAEDVINAYRQSVPMITAFWKLVESSCVETINTGNAVRLYHGLETQHSGANLHIKLPSDRSLVYRNARIEMRIPGYVKLLGLTPHRKPTIVYDHPYGYDGILYGGLITENIVQGLCSDILKDALKRYPRSEIVLHVHDEIVAERLTSAPSVLESIMSVVPLWATGLPLKCEVHTSERYNK